MGHLNNWSKFKLLFWKNWKIQFNHKLALLFQIILPVLLLQLAILLLHINAKPMTTKETHFPALDITELSLETRSELDSQNSKNKHLPLPVLLYSPNTSSTIDAIVKNAAESLQLSFKAYENAKQLAKALHSGNYLACVEFNDVDDVKLSFSLRFPSQLRASKDEKHTWMTTRLFPVPVFSGPRNIDDADGGHPVAYLREGFLAIQHAISMAYLKLASNNVPLPEVKIQRYPYPPWVKSHFVHLTANVLTAIILLTYMYPCMCLTKYITSERENQLKEIMKIMGLQSWMHWAAWFAQAFLLLIISAILIIIILKYEWIENGSLLSKCSGTVLFFFLLLYIANSICSCFMIATFFKNAGTAAAAFGLIWLMEFIPYESLTHTQDQRSLAHFLLWCFISNTAMGLGFRVIVGYELTGVGLQWSNLFTPVSIDERLTLGCIMLVMLASCVLEMLICLYVEQVFPGKFGVPRKWYFPYTVLRSYGKKEIQVEVVMRIERFIGSGPLHDYKPQPQISTSFEAEPVGKTVGIKIQNLEKRFDEKIIVRNLSINIYQDEITVLLGHNGSGKTTIISMLTGMFPPSSGTAFVNGCEIVTNTEGARMFVGICPHQNILFDDLSTRSNIEFFCRLKGLKGKAIENEVQKYLMMTDLKNAPYVASSHLSVGMKRMLTACCALCGGSKVVIFDEPSSDMNPLERKQLWNLLQAEKSGRTLLLTTHLKDEADVLADRIAIMFNGELKCYGTSFFLKKKYSFGYLLTCIKGENCNIDQVSALLRQFIRTLRPPKIMGAEFSYELSDKYSMNFEKMLKALEDNAEDLNVQSFGISMNSMADVFAKVGAEKLKRVATRKKDDSVSDDELEYVEPQGTFSRNKHLLWGHELCRNQWNAMFCKKYLYTWRKKLLSFVQMTFPLYFVVLIIVAAKLEGFNSDLPAMTISLTQYPASVTILERDDELENLDEDAIELKIADQYEQLANAGSAYTYQSTGNASFSEYILKLGETIQSQVDTIYLTAATIKAGEIIAWLNNAPLHTAPLTLNLVHNAMARALITPAAEIIIKNSPLPYEPNELYERYFHGYSLGYHIAMILCISMCIVSALYTPFLIRERACRLKLMQFVSGVQVWTFWMTHFIWDLVTFLVTALLIVLLIACFREPNLSTFTELARYFLVLFLFGLSMLPLMYFLSMFFTDSVTGFIYICIINFVGGFITSNISTLLYLSRYKHIGYYLNILLRVYPHFSMAMALSNLYINTAKHSVCERAVLETLTSAQSCKISPDCCELIPYFDRKFPGICPELVTMFLTSVIFNLIIIMHEYGWLKYYIRFRLSHPRKLPAEDFVNMDDDVWMEKQGILALTKFERTGENLVLDRVSKVYKHYLVVNQISLCVKRCTQLWNKCNRPKSAEIINAVINANLLTPCITRWNSLYDSVKRLLLHKTNLAELCFRLKMPTILSDELEYLEEYIKLMGPIAEAIDFLQGEKTMYFGYFVPTIVTLRLKMRRLEPASFKYLSEVSEKMQEALIKRFDKYFLMHPDAWDAVIAAISIPNIKLRFLKALLETATTQTEKEVKKMFNTYVVKYGKIADAETRVLPQTPQKSFLDFGEESNGVSIQCVSTDSGNYLQETILYLVERDTTTNCLKNHPAIKNVFLKYNTPLPSSAPVERLFSFAGIVNRSRRQKLSDVNFEMLVLRKANSV